LKIPFLDRTEELPGEAPNRGSFFRSEDPMFNEQFKNYSARFEHRVDTLSCRFVVITSAVAGEGKTTSAVNLAANIAATGRKKVLLVDADLRKSDLARGLRIPPVPGLSEHLAGSAALDDVLSKSPVKGFLVVPGGMRIEEPWQLIAGERFRAFREAVLERFDLVLLDTAPIIPVSDVLALRELADAFILVYRMGFTPHPLLRQALEEIGEKKLLGVLLNGVKPQSERYYQRYYGKYYKKRETR
jgi:capsular exopolysaccharide synthesis family protein